MLDFEGVETLARMVWGTYSEMNNNFTFKHGNLEKKVPQSARLSAGGCNCYLGNAQIKVALI